MNLELNRNLCRSPAAAHRANHRNIYAFIQSYLANSSFLFPLILKKKKKEAFVSKTDKYNNNASPWFKHSTIIHFGPSLRELKAQTCDTTLRLQVCSRRRREEKQRLRTWPKETESAKGEEERNL